MGLPVPTSIAPSSVVQSSVTPTASAPVSPTSGGFTLEPPATLPASPTTTQSSVPVVPAAPSTPFVGGTLLITRSGQYAIAAQPELDRVDVVNLDTDVVQTLTLAEHSIPTQVVEDGAGKVYVVLRGSSAVARLDIEAPSLDTLLSPVCAEPRGLAYAAASDEVIVACRSGELVWINASTAEIARSVDVADDLRDVVATDTGLWVSTFRGARVLQLDLDGTLVNEQHLAVVSDTDGLGAFEPHVATRMLQLSAATVAVQHQRANQVPLSGAYYAPSGASKGVVHSTLSLVSDDDVVQSAGVLPHGTVLDMAVNHAGTHYAALAHAGARTALFAGNLSDAVARSALEGIEPSTTYLDGTATAVTFDNDDRAVVQLVWPTRLVVIGDREIALTDGRPPSDGKQLFYAPTERGVACANCHPEGDEDGVTWMFAFEGLRRTQALAGRITLTQPLHWQGERPEMIDVLQDTLVARMGGSLPPEGTELSLTAFLDGLPLLRPLRALEASEVGQGRTVFEALKCDTCHAGDNLTDNLNHDVGTGAEFQTPSLLGVAYRLPVMHDGCAVTLEDRFGACGGDERHGDLSGLSADDRSLLIAYLEAL